jgi:WD40 repeat protein
MKIHRVHWILRIHSNLFHMIVILALLELFLIAPMAGQAKPPAFPSVKPKQNRPELVHQTGHAYKLRLLEFSADGKLVASADSIPRGGYHGDGTIKLWEVATGRQLRTLAGHSARIFALAFSPDKVLMASAGDDGTIRIWNVMSGREVHRMYARAHALFFSPDGRYLASLYNWGPYVGDDREPDPDLETCPHPDKPGLCEAKQLNIWDVRAGRFLYTVPPPDIREIRHSDYWSFAFSPDRRTLASGVTGRPISFREVSTGRKLHGIPGAMAPFAFDSAGKRLVARASDDTLAVWDTTSRIRLGSIHESGAPIAFASKRNSIVTRTETKGQRVARVWDARTGQMLVERRVNKNNSEINEFSFSANKEWVAAGSWGDGRLAFWNFIEAAAIPQAWSGLELPAAFSPDGSFAAAATAAGKISFVNLKTGKETCTEAGQMRPVGAVAISPTTHWLATGDGDTVHLWDLKAGLESVSLNGHNEFVTSLQFTADEKTLFSVGEPFELNSMRAAGFDEEPKDIAIAANQEKRTTGCLETDSKAEKATQNEIDDGSVAAWNVGTAELDYTFGGRAPLAISPDGKILAATEKKTVTINKGDLLNRDHSSVYVIGTKIWDVERKSLGTKLEEPSNPLRGTSSGSRVAVLAISENARLLATATWPDSSHPTISLWNIEAKKRTALEGPKDQITSLAFNPASDLLASGSSDHFIKLWHVALPNEIHCPIALDGAPTGLVFSHDGQFLMATVGDKIERYQVSNCEHKGNYIGNGNAVRGIVSGGGDSLLFAGIDDGSVLIWDERSRNLLATLVTLHGGTDWMVVTPDGLFDGSPRAWKQLLWRFGGNTFDVQPVESYFNEYFHPDLLAEIIRGERPTAPSSIETKDRRQPEIKFLGVEGQVEALTSASRMVNVRLEVAEVRADKHHHSSSGVRDVRLFRNGSLVRKWHDPVPLDEQGRAILQANVSIAAGVNQFTAYAFNNDNIKSLDATPLTITGTSHIRKGTAYILAIGVNRYRNSSFNLRYATSDAEVFASELKQEQDKLGAYQEVRIVPLKDEQATRANILEALARLAGKTTGSPSNLAPLDLDKIKPAEPEDAVFIFFAGHGMADGPRFYLIPHDLGYTGDRDAIDNAAIKILAQHGISDEDLDAAFEGIDAGRMMMVIDACNSGQALEAEEPRRGPMNSKGLAQLAYEKGMYILTAAKRYQDAKEVNLYSHGLLTQALVVEGLHQRKASTNGGNVYLREWLDYAVHEVPQLQLKSPHLPFGRGFPDKSGKTLNPSGPSQIDLQQPRVFYRREPETEPFLVAKPAVEKSPSSVPDRR